MAAAFEDVRMTRLRQAMAKTVDGTLGGVSLDDFLSCFPDLAQTHYDMLSELYEQLNEAVRSNVMQEFDKICRETNLVSKLNELDRLSNEKAQPAFVDDVAEIAPTDQMRDVRMRMKMEEREQLKLMLQQTEAQCEKAQERLESQREKVQTVEKALGDASSQLNSAATAAHDWLEAK